MTLFFDFNTIVGSTYIKGGVFFVSYPMRLQASGIVAQITIMDELISTTSNVWYLQVGWHI